MARANNPVAEDLKSANRVPTVPEDMSVENALRAILQRVVVGEQLNENSRSILHALIGYALHEPVNTPEPVPATRTQATTGTARPKPVGEAFYGLPTPTGLKYIKVQKNLTGDRTYAKMWMPDSESWSYEAARDAGAMRKLRPEMVLTADQAKEFGQLYGQCVFCGRQLNDERSIDAGYGPVCAENRGLPWG